MNNFRYLFLILFFSVTLFAQDGLVNSLKANASEKSKENFKFTDVINLANTPVKAQGSSGTCWSYATNSFLESEMIRSGKAPVELSVLAPEHRIHRRLRSDCNRFTGSIAFRPHYRRCRACRCP